MRRSALPNLAWAALLAASTGLLWAFTPTWVPLALLGGSAALTLLVGLYLAARPARSEDEDEERDIPDVSLATVGLAAGIAVAGLGLVAGAWLAYIGAGVAAFGALGLLRERRVRE
jgi:hypothetical protein